MLVSASFGDVPTRSDVGRRDCRFTPEELARSAAAGEPRLESDFDGDTDAYHAYQTQRRQRRHAAAAAPMTAEDAVRQAEAEGLTLVRDVRDGRRASVAQLTASEALYDPIFGCRNGIIADYNDVVAACTRGNAMFASFGAGSGSKATAMYLINYASKESVQISVTATVLLDAR